jgi:hypothetical protein
MTPVWTAAGGTRTAGSVAAPSPFESVLELGAPGGGVTPTFRLAQQQTRRGIGDQARENIFVAVGEGSFLRPTFQ